MTRSVHLRNATRSVPMGFLETKIDEDTRYDHPQGFSVIHVDPDSNYLIAKVVIWGHSVPEIPYIENLLDSGWEFSHVARKAVAGGNAICFRVLPGREHLLREITQFYTLLYGR